MRTCTETVLRVFLGLSDRIISFKQLRGCLKGVSKARKPSKTVATCLSRFVRDGVLNRPQRGQYELKMTKSDVAKYMSSRGGSKGEKAICRFLEMWKIPYVREKSFNNLKDVSCLRYDFYIEKDGKQYLFEFHGRQHFEPVEYFGGESSFRVRCINDLRKEIYAEENGISLTVINNINFISIAIKNALGMKRKRKYDEI